MNYTTPAKNMKDSVPGPDGIPYSVYHKPKKLIKLKGTNNRRTPYRSRTQKAIYLESWRHMALVKNSYNLYETILFGRVTHTPDAAAIQVRFLFYLTFSNISVSCSLKTKENICCSITCVSLIEIFALN